MSVSEGFYSSTFSQTEDVEVQYQRIKAEFLKNYKQNVPVQTCIAKEGESKDCSLYTLGMEQQQQYCINGELKSDVICSSTDKCEKLGGATNPVGECVPDVDKNKDEVINLLNEYNNNLDDINNLNYTISNNVTSLIKNKRKYNNSLSNDILSQTEIVAKKDIEAIIIQDNNTYVIAGICLGAALLCSFYYRK